jgi:hypothetical protein
LTEVSIGNVARNPIEPDHSYEAENFGDGKSSKCPFISYSAPAVLTFKVVKERAVVNSVNPKKGHTYMRSENVGLSKRAIADGVDTDRSGYDHYHYDDSGAEKRAVVEAVEPDRSYDHFHYDDVSSEKRAIVEARELEGRHGFTAKSTDKTIQRAVEDTADMDRSGYDHFHYDDSGAEKRAVVEGVDPDRSYGHFHYDDAGVSK